MADSVTVGKRDKGVRPRPRPKGRQLESDALVEIRALLGKRERRHDLLIEFLHLIQDRYGHLSARHLKALGDELRLPMAAVYEVATFYHHFDVVKEDETPPPPLTIRVCDSLSCAMAGAEKLQAGLEAGLDPSQVRVLPAWAAASPRRSVSSASAMSTMPMPSA
jgi:NADH:ubiquinone oxidoreductase subunit E